MQKPTIALIGATGKAGSYILQHLLNAGYPVKALIRNTASFSIEHIMLTVINSDVTDIGSVKELLQNCAVVISALGQKPGEPLVCATASRNLLQVMKEQGINRFIFLAGLTIDVPGDQKSDATQAKTNWMRQHYAEAMADKQLAYEIVAQSAINYTLIRLPVIERTDEQRGMTINLYDCPGDTISTADLANFVVEQITNESYIRHAPIVASLN